MRLGNSSRSTVTIDDHETVLTFESREDAERFAQVER
jgi:hypothetical protein